MQPAIEMGGPVTRSDVTVKRVYSDGLHAAYYALDAVTGKASMQASYTPLDANGNPAGDTFIYTGIVKQVMRPQIRRERERARHADAGDGVQHGDLEGEQLMSRTPVAGPSPEPGAARRRRRARHGHARGGSLQDACPPPPRGARGRHDRDVRHPRLRRRSRRVLPGARGKTHRKISARVHGRPTTRQPGAPRRGRHADQRVRRPDRGRPGRVAPAARLQVGDARRCGGVQPHAARGRRHRPAGVARVLPRGPRDTLILAHFEEWYAWNNAPSRRRTRCSRGNPRRARRGPS
jgi:hypothetical protein